MAGDAPPASGAGHDRGGDLVGSRQPGLGAEFIEEVIRVWDELSENPLLNSQRHPAKNIRWGYPDRFPYIYEVLDDEQAVIVAAVLHAARHDRHWQRRIASESRGSSTKQVSGPRWFES